MEVPVQVVLQAKTCDEALVFCPIQLANRSKGVQGALESETARMLHFRVTADERGYQDGRPRQDACGTRL